MTAEASATRTVGTRTIALVVAAALFMENIDSTILSTALPTIASDLNVNPLALKLALTSYLISLAIFIPPSGWVADRFGARRVFAAAVLVFMAGSVACTTVSTLEGFVVARFLQGIGGAMMVPVGRLIVARNTPKQGFVSAMAWLTMPALLGPVLGPLVGGIIALWLSGEYLSVPASVGFIALLGIAVLNGLVLVSHFNHLHALGLPMARVVREGAMRRLRPVLMTATITAFGLVPLLLASGPGSEIQRPLAIVVIGGLASSTALTLLLLPLLYWRLGQAPAAEPGEPA